MKQTNFLKPSRCLLIALTGVLMPLAAVHAEDATPRYGTTPGQTQSPVDLQRQMPDSSQSDADRTMQTNPPAAGEQGPVRSEMSDDQGSSKRDTGTKDSKQDKDKDKMKDDAKHRSMWKSDTP